MREHSREYLRDFKIFLVTLTHKKFGKIFTDLTYADIDVATAVKAN